MQLAFFVLQLPVSHNIPCLPPTSRHFLLCFKRFNEKAYAKHYLFLIDLFIIYGVKVKLYVSNYDDENNCNSGE
jgi:hypothetical protein